MSWLTTSQAAGYSGYCTKTVLRAAAEGKLKGAQGKREWRFKESDLDRWILGK